MLVRPQESESRRCLSLLGLHVRTMFRRSKETVKMVARVEEMVTNQLFNVLQLDSGRWLEARRLECSCSLPAVSMKVGAESTSLLVVICSSWNAWTRKETLRFKVFRQRLCEVATLSNDGDSLHWIKVVHHRGTMTFAISRLFSRVLSKEDSRGPRILLQSSISHSGQVFHHEMVMV
jgi:hypothetical protein